MKRSLASRLFRTVFTISLATAVLSIFAIDFLYDDMDHAILDIELNEEGQYFRDNITDPAYQQWQTAHINAIFLGKDQPRTRLPEYLRNLRGPLSEELEIGEKTFLVRIENVDSPAGQLYVSQDTSVLEEQEFLAKLAILAVLLGMTLLGLIFAKLSARRLTKPLRDLVHQIHSTTPASTMRRLPTDYQDTEFADISEAFNRFLEALEAFVEREKSFVKLASHELRTPLAVITGALDIIEKRDTLSPADRRTLSRIRRAAGDMQADVDVLLKLARGNVDTDQQERVSLRHSILDTIADLESSQTGQPGRLQFQDDDGDLLLLADPALLRMLIRNLLQNALKHTRANVDIRLTETGLRITDYGPGLPGDIVERLERPLPRHAQSMQENSFGLLIVQLICERLGWELVVLESGHQGTELDLLFDGSIIPPEAHRRAQSHVIRHLNQNTGNQGDS